MIHEFVMRLFFFFACLPTHILAIAITSSFAHNLRYSYRILSVRHHSEATSFPWMGVKSNAHTQTYQLEVGPMAGGGDLTRQLQDAGDKTLEETIAIKRLKNYFLAYVTGEEHDIHNPRY